MVNKNKSVTFDFVINKFENIIRENTRDVNKMDNNLFGETFCNNIKYSNSKKIIILYKLFHNIFNVGNTINIQRLKSDECFNHTITQTDFNILSKHFFFGYISKINKRVYSLENSTNNIYKNSYKIKGLKHIIDEINELINLLDQSINDDTKSIFSDYYLIPFYKLIK